MREIILVVDDMAIVRDPIAASLQLGGYQTVCAANGIEALKAVQTQAPSLILLDMSMPVMDGLTFLRALRADHRYKNLPVILLTAISEKQHVLEAAKLGIQDYLLKSKFSLADLMVRVKKHLATAQTPPAQPDAPAKTPDSAAAA